MSNEKQSSYEIQLNSIDYSICLIESDHKLCIELSDIGSADSWKATFESNYIEELTKKTGNFKSFPIFVNMLKTAFKKTSNSVTVELLTYSDLEALRCKKTNSNEASTLNFNTQNNKRFLILTYNVEFDRINYPLQLNYQGKTNVKVLVDTIKKLKGVIKGYENQNLTKSFEPKSREATVRDSEELDTSFETKTDSKLQKESKLLRQMVKTIEEKSLKEKNLYQKQLQKKKQEVEILKNELQQSRINERNLKNEIKCLNNELKVLRQRKPTTSNLKRTSSTESFRSLTRDDSIRSYHGHISRDMSRSSSRNNSLVRGKSVSPAPSVRSVRSNHSIDSNGNRKFNPTEYVKNKKNKLEEVKMKRQRDLRNKLNGSKGSLNDRNYRSSNVSLNDSLGSFYSSDNQSECNSISSRLSRKNMAKVNQKSKTSSNPKYKSNSKGASNRKVNEDKYLNDIYGANDEMKEIDAKLKSLQMLIKTSS